MTNTDRKKDSKHAERMDPEHIFQFNCAPGVPCFTECCRDVTIALTPYDVVRLKTTLGLSSEEFLDKYTIITAKRGRLIPLVVLKMNEDDKKCPFVSETGCNVYEDRPWPCRMFPLDMADDGTFTLIANGKRCKGLFENEKWRVGEWLVEQGVVPYDEMNGLFAEITAPLRAQEPDIQNPDIQKMIFMATYNLDKFRSFVFKSTFIDRFDISKEKIEKIKRSDVELLKFGFDWIKFGIFGQILFRLKEQTEGEAR